MIMIKLILHKNTFCSVPYCLVFFSPFLKLCYFLRTKEHHGIEAEMLRLKAEPLGEATVFYPKNIYLA